MDLGLERWTGLAPAARESLAKQIPSRLGAGFEFVAIRRHRMGEIERDVALYRSGGADFAFVPGGRVRVGYDADRTLDLNAEEAEDWAESASEYDLPARFSDYVESVTLRPREVDLPPLLVETIAHELGWTATPLDGPEARELLARHQGPGTIERSGVRVRRTRDGAITAERQTASTHGEVAAQLRAQGFRFPTSDEWEHLCGAAAPTLFRWGDHAPADRSPIDPVPVPSPGVFGADWDDHRRPTACGVLIASNPYHNELVDEAGITRGGDGGGMICGGAGFVLGWLTLATAYYEEHACRLDPQGSIPSGYAIGRRVLDLRACTFG